MTERDTYSYVLDHNRFPGGAYVVLRHGRPTEEHFSFERDAQVQVKALNENADTIVRKLTIVIEQRDDGTVMVSTEGNPLGDWLRRTGDVSDALEALDIATDSTDGHGQPLWLWGRGR